MQLEGGGKLLISHRPGRPRIRLATGKLLKDVAIYDDVSSARRLPNGDLILAGVDSDGKKLSRGDDPVGGSDGPARPLH